MRIKSEKLVFVLGFLMIAGFFLLGLKLAPASFAEDEKIIEEVEYASSSPNHFVTIYDGNTKKTIKTGATTVQEVLDRLNISIDATDSVSPALETQIDADQYNINI